MGGRPEATIIGLNLKASRVDAAFVNGALNHCLDFDDTTLPSISHPTTTTLPAALSLGEYGRRTGKDVILSYVIGKEIFDKVAGCVNPGHW